MKICIVIGAFLPVPPLKGGAVEKMWYRLAGEFAILGHQVVMVSRTMDGLPHEELVAGIAHVRVRGYDMARIGVAIKAQDFLYARRACKVIPSDADVIVTNTFWAPILISGTRRARVCVDVARMPKGQMRFYRNVGRLRANSTAVAAAIRGELPPSAHELVSMIPNPLPFSPVNSGDDRNPRSHLLYVGRVHPEKGLHVLINALRRSTLRHSLRVVGPWLAEEGGGGGKYMNHLKELARGLPIEFVGPIYDIDALNAEYRRAQLFVYPSLAEEGETFGLAPLEAMAWGCVPIVSDLLCFRDFISQGNNGLVFDHRTLDPALELAHCIDKAAANSHLMTSMADRARDVRTSHSPRKIAEAFLEDFALIAQRATSLR